jgi:hypothetical protein
MTTTVPPDTRAMPKVKRARPGWVRRVWIRWGRKWWPLVAAAVVVAAGLLLYLGQLGAEQELDTTEQELDATVQQGVALGNPVLDYCDEQTPVGDALRSDPRNPCGLAEQIVSAPVAQPPPAPSDGTDGADGGEGPAGRGIRGTDVNAAGHLIISYSDGTTEDVGLVVGRDGGEGPVGRGIADSDIVDGRLVLTYSDGERVDLGPVVGRDGRDGADGEDGDDGGEGPAGRGIADVGQVEGRLVITYTDGTTQDVGPLPTAPPVEPPPQTEMWCPPGQTPATVTYGIGGETGTACVAS